MSLSRNSRGAVFRKAREAFNGLKKPVVDELALVGLTIGDVPLVGAALGQVRVALGGSLAAAQIYTEAASRAAPYYILAAQIRQQVAQLAKAELDRANIDERHHDAIPGSMEWVRLGLDLVNANQGVQFLQSWMPTRAHRDGIMGDLATFEAQRAAAEAALAAPVAALDDAENHLRIMLEDALKTIRDEQTAAE